WKCSSKAGMNEFSCWKVSEVTLPPAAGLGAAAPAWPGTTRASVATGFAAGAAGLAAGAAADAAVGLDSAGFDSVGLLGAVVADGEPADWQAATIGSAAVTAAIVKNR